MRIESLVTSEIGTNTYIVTDGAEAMVIDPGVWEDRLAEKLRELNVKCVKVVLTHGHFDHAAATAALEQQGAKVYVYYTEESLNNPLGSLAQNFGVPYTPYRPEVLLHDGENVSFGGVQFHVLHTPGHTPGSICLIGNGVIFSGDTLFCESVGRTDFPGGSASDLRESLRKLFLLSGDYTVFPGHGAFTTLDYERTHNPYANA